MDTDVKRLVLTAQRNELTDHRIYLDLAGQVADEHNRKVLTRIAEDEKRHHDFWKRISGQDVQVNAPKVRWFVFLAKTLGLSFALKLREKAEDADAHAYEYLAKHYKGVERIIADEKNHEKAVLDMLDDERVAYAGAIVLGLNDALVELTGALAGFTLALRDTRIIALTGMITGIAASLSMAASGYLSSREDRDAHGDGGRAPLKSAIYTGVAYIITVILLILPYLLSRSVAVALPIMLSTAILIIAAYTFYMSVAKTVPFKKRFVEMAVISLTVAVISFGIGYVLHTFFGLG
ncbi:MAG: VIT1/CCC1 transporter family protein [Nanoarchaeota archaeon]